MRISVLVVVSFLLLNKTFAQGNNDTSNAFKAQYSACYTLERQAALRRIGRLHGEPLIIANGVVIRGKEIKTEMLDSVHVLKCPQSFEKYGDLGALGVILIKTRQTFRTVTIGELAKLKEMESGYRHISYALNGYLATDTSQRISLKAIKRIDMITSAGVGADKYETTHISIWTVTGKQIRQYKRRPKPCMGVGNVYTNK